MIQQAKYRALFLRPACTEVKCENNDHFFDKGRVGQLPDSIYY